MDFDIHIAKIIKIGNMEVYITESMINSWVICGWIILAAVIIRILIRNPQKVPSKVQNAIEFVVDSLDKFTVSTMGKHGMTFSSFYAGMFLYILLSNLSGLFVGPNFNSGVKWELGFMRPPTADIAVTFALAMITFFMTQGFAMKEKGVGGWFKGLLDPIPALLPLNIVGELANPVSLSFRLFGNILGGTIIMGLFYQLPWFAKIGVPVFLHAYFDIFAGGLQAFIFIMLSMTFVSSAMD